MNNSNNKTIENRVFEAIKATGESKEVTVKELYKNFPEINEKTISWSLYNLVQKNRLYKTGRGIYSLKDKAANYSMGYDYLSQRAKKIYNSLMDYGYRYYITGIDALSGELLHMTDDHPIIIVVEEESMHEIQEILINQSMIVITESERRKYKEMMYYENYQVLIIKGKKFDF
ncbi:MAG: hypothetical protein PF505_05115, partial [Vallitaleaceae bacterium]|nr:hypothetical protein [Vallitaleaceae bacterium]